MDSISRQGSKVSRIRLFGCFAMLLGALTAVPVLAAEPPVPDADEVPLPPHSVEATGSWVPDAATVQKGIERSLREQASRKSDLQTPEAVRERAESQDAFAAVDREGAEALLRGKFGSQLSALNADPARRLSRADVVRPLGGTAATVIEDGEGALLDSGFPVKVEDEAGKMMPLDVELESAAGGLETSNAPSDVSVGKSAAAPVELGDEGVAISQVGARGSSATRRFGGQNAFQFETQTDTDTLISPIAGGVEIFNLLRSEHSPESIDFEIDVPQGAELRDYGDGGAAVFKGSKPIALVPPPTAVDAQGTDVPVNLVVQGDSIRLETGHRQHDYAYPILLDPILQEYQWYTTGEVEGLWPEGAWQFVYDPLMIVGTGDPCYYRCWGRGLYITAPSRNYPANVYSHWVYSAPNSHSYVENVNLPVLVRDEHNCSSPAYAEPHDYIGYVDNNGNWQPWAGNPYVNASKAGSAILAGWGRAYVFGAGTGAGINIPCWRDFYAGVAGVWLNDWELPAVSPPTGIPSGWIDGKTSFTIQAATGDVGLGVNHVKLFTDGKPALGDINPEECTGLYNHRCPTSYNAAFTQTGLSFGEGLRGGSIVVSDPTGKSAEQFFQTKVDRSKPVVSLAGQLARETDADEGEEKGDEEIEKLTLPVYNLKIEATDEGNETDPQHRKRSGVKDIEVWVDGDEKAVPWEPTPSCEASCARTETYTLALSELETGGVHKLEVKVTDFAGNEKVRDIEFEYLPATGMKDEYLMHYFPLPDGSGEEDEEEHPRRPELAVNVMNGNLVYRQVDVDVESSAALDLTVERYYNSMLPDSENSEWGDGWTLAETPDLDPGASGTAPATVATMTQDPALTERYFSLWLDMPTPAGARAGYELSFELTSADTYDVTLSGWQGGSESVLESESAVAFADGDSLALVDEGATVSAWTDTGSGFAQLLSAGDGTFGEGRAGLYGAGNIVRLADFRAGELDASSDTAAQLAALPLTEPFDGTEASDERFQSEWSTLGWAGGGTPKGADTTSGWRPVDAFASAANGAFYNQSLGGSGGEGPEEAELLDPSGAIESEVPLPTEEGQEEFDPELQVTLKKKASGGYLMTDETGESAGAVAFDKTGQAEALVSEGDAKVDYTYEGGALSEIAVEDPGTAQADPSEVELAEPEATEGTPLFHSSFGTLGSEDAEFDTPTDVAIGADGDLWVADYANDRVQHFNPAGEYVGQFGAQGSGDGQLSRPASIAIDAEGDIWVVDKNNYRIQKFSPEGEYLDQFGSQGSAAGQFNHPEGIAIDASGDIWVSDTYNYRIQKFTPEGELVEVVEPEGLGAIEPTGIDAGPDGKVWIADWSHNRVAAVSEEGEFELSSGSAGSGPGQFSRPDAIEADENGNVWVGDQNNGRIQRFDQTGEYVDEFGSKGSGEGQFSFGYPFGFAVGEDRRVWVADRDNDRVQRWDPPYEVSEEALPEDDDPSVDVDVEGGMVDAVSGEETGEIDYEHEGELLTAVDGPEGETEYEYDEEGRMTKVTLPNETYAEIAYFDDGRVKSVTVAPEGAEAKTTWFSYTDTPERQTVVDPPDDPHITYDIGEDGSVLKWWNTAKPPELSLHGSLYDHREIGSGEEGALFAGDHELQVEAEDNEGIASIEIIVGGDVLVEEFECEQTEEPGIECEEPDPLPWVMETAANPPGHLQIEAIATDSEGESTSERFWVDIPEPPPPPAPGTPIAPTFREIKQFRKEYGLEINFPVANQIELNERIFNLIKAWHEPNTPAGRIARASWERWGVPLRPEDVAELDHRLWLYDHNADQIDRWFGEATPGDFAGYYLDHSAGGIMRIGFVAADQGGKLHELEQALSLEAGEAGAAGDRLQSYPVTPTVPYVSIRATVHAIAEAKAAIPTLAELIVSVEDDEAGGSVYVKTAHAAQVESLLESILGPTAPVEVEQYGEAGELLSGRFRDEGRMRAGDRIFNQWHGVGVHDCTAGFGAKDYSKKDDGGKTIKRLFLLTVGHCTRRLGDNIYRCTCTKPEGGEVDNNEDEWNEVGEVRRNSYIQNHPFEPVHTDAEAVRIKQKGVVPQVIFGVAGKPIPYRAAERARKDDVLCYSGATQQNVGCGVVVHRTADFDPGGGAERTGGYFVKMSTKAARAGEGDSGSPVWKMYGRAAVGLVSAGRPTSTLKETLVEPLLHPRGMEAYEVPGILHHPDMAPLTLKFKGG